MKYYINRTSSWDGQPCEEAFQERFVSIDRRTIPTPEDFDEKVMKKFGGKPWFAEGMNHRVEDGCICRDMNAVLLWVVDLDGDDAILAFSKKYGPIVLQRENGYHGLDWRLEIYDDYRE